MPRLSTQVFAHHPATRALCYAEQKIETDLVGPGLRVEVHHLDDPVSAYPDHSTCDG